MAIPPFPSQDLAKLVLGYLAEEQLMTAYDEFLQASPYLDALRNEYDRILMTSLKHILAEYRAVKIYVETCKPFALRKKLLQCYNLLEMVKFLIENVDTNKLNEQEQSIEKSSFTKNVNVVPPSNPVQPSSQSSSQIENSMLDSSVEATSLDDLPGNSTIKKKTLKAVETKNSHTNVDCESKVCPVSNTNVNMNSLLTEVKNVTVNPQTGPNNLDLMKCNKSESVQKIEEFNNILDYVCKNGRAEQNTYSLTNNVTNQNQRLSTAGTFQDFTTGIYNSGSVHVSYSTTPSDNNAQAPSIRNTSTYVNIGGLTKEELMSKGHFVLTVDSSKNSQGVPLITTSSPTITQANKKIETRKREENKIKILSDVIVDKSYESLSGKQKMPPVLSNATSTPFQMPNMLINGTPAYKNNVKSHCLAKLKYTTDEIMAMPTIILVPASGTPASSTDSGTVAPLSTDPKPLTITSNSSQDLLKPLLIDVTSPVINPPVSSSNIVTNEQNNIESIEQNLIKTVESTENILKSKDNTINTTNSTLPKTTTPQGVLPNRKSSSTPRRNSHVRVLDFTTPRRILTETINEQSPERNSSDNQECNETVQVPCKEPKVQIDVAVSDNVISIENPECPKLKTNVAKENKAITKKNWDSDIRAAAVCGINTPVKSTQKIKTKTKEKATRKKKSDEDKNSKKRANKDTSKEKKKKDKSDSKDYKENDFIESEQKATPVVKANVNIRSDNNIVEDKKIVEDKNIVERKRIVEDTNIVEDKKILEDKKTTEDKNQINFYGSIDRTETPENERIALQNVIGAKLNISDLLETPYKQVLYDIQMDTPKFLGTDLPDEPMSEVKIMSIPTPRFLRDSNEKNSTPSCCYSSRPTDYSSGGSYYKPDDQDFIICTDVPQSSPRQEENSKSNNDITSTKPELDNKESKSGRPVRQCTKNVSYKDPLFNGKSIPLKSLAQSCVINEDSTVDNASEDRVSSKSSKDITVKEKRKQDTNKTKKSVKKIKSPIKRDTPKTFMKIKPRRTTPTKELLGGKSRKTSESTKQKKINSKERNENLTSVTATIPTKSRRKSSTPRKLHCTKTFNSESSDHTSPETAKPKQDKTQEDRARSRESDVEIPLRWSDDGSQDETLKNKLKSDSLSVTDTDDISKIKEYIETCATEKPELKDGEGSLHYDLIKRGFDVETAKKLERDLLDSPCAKREIDMPTECFEIKTNVSESITGSGDSYSLKIEDGDDDEDDEEIELSIHECNEDTVNYIHYEYDDADEKVSGPQSKLKDNYSMEICVDDGVTIRLRATTFSVLLDQDPHETEVNYSYKETAMAVSSISNFDKLYTPLKDHKAQMYDIFDSTLTSLDTPLKIGSSKSPECEHNNITEISLEVEKMEYVEKTDLKKRKRLQSGSSEESINCTKKTKRETQYLLNTTNIQNIDIESVLSKLHGP
ncbi:hypothetical protein RR46_14839 [Papilio xuthus]|uniref:LisH domain-containing protein n=1 Tax=Papilio xuthus TaxID=66420 RepID=A0A194PJR8_PAPXU|nr:hypothetical protein RR46_14839 [Papilio xuthus]